MLRKNFYWACISSKLLKNILIKTISSQVDGELDSSTAENKRLLGLQDSDASVKELNKDSFVKDFQEINKILNELNKDVIFFTYLKFT